MSNQHIDFTQKTGCCLVLSRIHVPTDGEESLSIVGSHYMRKKKGEDRENLLRQDTCFNFRTSPEVALFGSKQMNREIIWETMI